MKHSLREYLEKVLWFEDKDRLHDEIASGRLDEAIPRLQLIAGCDQGTKMHLEGDVAAHTSLVYVNILINAQKELSRNADFIERLAALVHDWKKPETRQSRPDGSVSFPGHEAKAAASIADLAKHIGLSHEEEQRLHFLVAEHGNAYEFPRLSEKKQNELRNAPDAPSLAILQKSDAQACLVPGGGHRPVYSHLIMSREEK
jgi:hypothetical protein